MTEQQLTEAAERLHEAVRTGRPCAPVRDLFAPGDVDGAYAVQRLNVARAQAAGARRVGRKIGLTSVAVQRQLGVDQPDVGTLFDSMAVGQDEPIAATRLLQPKIEAEVAFVLAVDLPDRPVTALDVLRATEFVLPALEVVDSRVAAWDITIVDTVADNASSGLFVLGTRPVSPGAIDLPAAPMRLDRDGVEVSAGAGAACLGDPVNAVVWLANTAQRLGDPLRGGELVLSGALGPMVPVTPGARYAATIGGLGTVRATFGEEGQ
ncbi:2-keto-4-pentenoate hydratase [Micromonospora sp. NPDC003816]|uniref:2-keto-4-pentenoate hydratase n=1 Tax=Micromonospora sp. NPDC003816 TaxID=3364224 RepID=UPI0036D01507